MRHEVPRRPLADCAKRFVVEKFALLPRKKWGGLCQKSPKIVGPTCQNRVRTGFDRSFTLAETF
ncbi:hypothetical protein EQV93_12840 [Pseudomonas sp. TMW22091]|uniref:Uncharacterized protein n=1 Tax=Pseudomonas saxonica TaxID=2600598 RepID=A0A5C5PSH5_9PSED|nr:hypothetical protein [Pseudomonas sp. TMW22091]TWR82903.1 hypothetical protein FJD37_21390 [Pseudomonas saxonica]TWR91175.1 hypothetical protein FJD38_08910 [Pseudomonas saxonica]